jgi:hypothetical protein
MYKQNLVNAPNGFLDSLNYLTFYKILMRLRTFKAGETDGQDM